ncbi:MAG: hypothetical protein L6Q95_19740, partial [Planctomycetes bacterium]|nr:hypothetical protein [Planctomycetota bacterium]
GQAVPPAARAFARQVLGETEAYAGRAEDAARHMREAMSLVRGTGNDAARAETLAAAGGILGDRAALGEALVFALRLNLRSARLMATCALGAPADAEKALEECSEHVPALVRMDAAFDVFGLTGKRRWLDEAIATLRHIERHAPAARRAALRAHPLQARILAALPPGPPPS